MPKKHKHHQSFAASPADLRPRIERARQEGRFQQALDLAKQLHKYEPTPDHLELLKEVYLGRARQLRSQGQTRDAITVLDVALGLAESTPAWLDAWPRNWPCAATSDGRWPDGRTDRCGQCRPHPGPRRRCRPAARCRRPRRPDAAAASRFRSPSPAFEQVESGQDEAARETLQGIGLRSPFLEWKLLLRGLQAYWHNDDVRAVENWQRLTPERLPARLAAPFRFRIDAGFRAAQPPATQSAAAKTDRPSARLDLVCRTCAACKRPWPTRKAGRGVPAGRGAVAGSCGRKRRRCCRAWPPAFTGPSSNPDPTTCCAISASSARPPDDPNFHRLQRWPTKRATICSWPIETGRSTSMRSPRMPRVGRAIRPTTPAPSSGSAWARTPPAFPSLARNSSRPAVRSVR